MRQQTLHARPAGMLGVVAAAVALAACDTADQDPMTSAVRSQQEQQGGQGQASTSQQDAGEAQQGQQQAAQPDDTGAAGQQQDSGQATTGQASEDPGGEAAREIGAFSPTSAPQGGEGLQGRLPAEGDQAIYIANTELFPGAARLDPRVENPYSGDPDAISAGERHFAAFNCAGCHAPLAGGGMGPPLSDDDWIHGGEPAQIFMTIMHGRPEGMPSWSSMLPRRTVWELVAYIETLNEIENYAAELGFDSEHSTSTTLEQRWGGSGAGDGGQPQQ